MPSHIFLIIGAGLAVLGSIPLICKRGLHTYSDLRLFLNLVAIALYLGAALLLAMGIFTPIKKIPNDSARVLTREGEVFKVLEAGLHYNPELVPYDEQTINARPRYNTFWEEKGGREEDVTVQLGSFQISDVTVKWQPDISSNENVIRIWELYKRHGRQVSPSVSLWFSAVLPVIKESISTCWVDIQADSEELVDNFMSCPMEAANRVLADKKIPAKILEMEGYRFLVS